MKKLASACALIGALSSCGPGGATSAIESRHTNRTDLERDLSLPLGILGTPFGDHRFDKRLPEQKVKALGNMLDRCAQIPFHFDSIFSTVQDAAQSVCPNELATPVYNEEKAYAKVTFTLNNENYTAITFDGKDSDGGDQVDLAIYDGAGKRVGVYTYIYGDQDVIEALSVAGEVALKRVRDGKPMRDATWQPLNAITLKKLYCFGQYAGVEVKDGKISISGGPRYEEVSLNGAPIQDGQRIIVAAKLTDTARATLTLNVVPAADGTYDGTLVADKTANHAALNEKSLICAAQ